MRRVVGILSIAVVLAFGASTALAADPYEHGKTAGVAGTGGYMGEHTMTGRITDIDKDKGRVTVEAQGEDLDVHFPPSALQTLNKGDQVMLSLGIKPAPGTRGGDMPPTR